MYMTELTIKQEAFARAMADPECPGVLAAYERAGYSVAGAGAHVSASRLRTHPNVSLRIAELRAAATERVVASVEGVLREWLTIATADPSEIVRTRRFACRHCYGIGHAYQWRDEDEWARALAAVMDRNAAREHKRGYVEEPLPTCDGGFGFDRARTPVEACPQCNGDGELDVYVEDTSRLSYAARKLFAGVKTTQHGVEIKFRDQDAAVANLAKALGMFVEKHEHSGPGGGPIPSATVIAELPAKQASDIYARVMQSK